jgi:cob(I)alamin adenosyltransferase
MFRPTSPTPPRKTSRGSPVGVADIGGASVAAEGPPDTEARWVRRLRGYPWPTVRIYTKKGDDGTTGRLYGGRVSKADPATEAYGSVDEAVAAMGMVRALASDDPYVNELILRLQRELFVVGADLATNPDDRRKLKPGVSLATEEMVARLEGSIDDMVEVHPLPQEFIVPGANPVSAALDVARTAVRRAERRSVELRDRGGAVNPEALRYLNRLSDLLFVLARWQAGGDEAPSRDR